MRYLALACDYDGTLAWDGQIAAPTVAALLASARQRPQDLARHRP